MKFFVSSTLYYHISGPGTILGSLRCAKSEGQTVLEESLSTNPEADRSDLVIGSDNNNLTRLDVDMEGDFQIQYSATVDIDSSIAEMSSIGERETQFPGPEAIPYLFPSRYAPADRMRNIAYDLFGHIKGHLAQAIAIEEWLHQNIYYVSGVSTEQSWSLDTYESRTGVCRDFAHLGISLCRALSIPARYVTVYAFQLCPADFHAIYEVYIGDSWFAFDGTRKAPLNGMIRIANGRDAADTAVANLFGSITGQGLAVNTLLSKDETKTFSPMTRESLRERGQILKLGG